MGIPEFESAEGIRQYLSETKEDRRFELWDTVSQRLIGLTDTAVNIVINTMFIDRTIKITEF